MRREARRTEVRTGVRWGWLPCRHVATKRRRRPGEMPHQSRRLSKKEHWNEGRRQRESPYLQPRRTPPRGATTLAGTRRPGDGDVLTWTAARTPRSWARKSTYYSGIRNSGERVTGWASP